MQVLFLSIVFLFKFIVNENYFYNHLTNEFINLCRLTLGYRFRLTFYLTANSVNKIVHQILFIYKLKFLLELLHCKNCCANLSIYILIKV